MRTGRRKQLSVKTKLAMSKIKPQPKRWTTAQHGTKDYIRREFAEWDNAVAMSAQRSLAIAAWDEEKNSELRGVRDKKLFDEISEKYDYSFAAILKKYPIKTIHDYRAFDRAAGLEGYRNGKKFDQFAAGKGSKADALQKLILDLVRKKPKLSLRELIASLEAQIGQGVIVEIDEEVATSPRLE